MAIRARSILLGVLVLLVVLVLGAITAVGWQVVFGPKMRPLSSRTFASSPQRLERGRYLVENVASCFHCHSEHDLADPEGKIIPAKKGAGWHLPIPELGELWARNITSDPDTGIGKWTDDAVARAIQEGVSADGRPLFPVMPYMNFRNLDEEDLASIVVYLRTIPPVKNEVPLPKLPFPLSILVKTMPKPLESHAAAAPRTTPAARGEYLVRNVANCGDCHTPADNGQPLPGMDFGGGGLFHDPTRNMTPTFSANITQDPSGIAHYDEALFIQTLHTGQIGGRRLAPIMPFENFKGMTDDDLRDIFAYLKTLPHVKHRVSNTDPPTKCVLCNQEHGLGNLNVKVVK